MNAQDIKQVAVIGSGLIGSSWATLFASKNLHVTLYDIDNKALLAAQKRIEQNLSYLKKEGIYTEEQVRDFLKNVVYTTSVEEAVKNAQFIQENGPDRIEIKKNILSEIEKHASAEAIYASSTSALLISEIASFAEHPERCIGGHPYNPPHLIPLVEITKGPDTSKETVKFAYQFYKSIGKEPVVLNKESMGFIANRLQAALNRELVDMVMKGICSVEDADKALTFGPGLRWGILGQTLNAHLGGGEKGIKGMIELTASSSKAMNGSLATWSEMPEGWADTAQRGVEEEMANREGKIGKTLSEISAYRDHMLIQLLKLHEKI